MVASLSLYAEVEYNGIIYDLIPMEGMCAGYDFWTLRDHPILRVRCFKDRKNAGEELIIPAKVPMPDPDPIYGPIYIPVVEIGKGAFQNCTEITSVQLPPTIEEIGHDAFYNCTSLSEINLPNSIFEIGYCTFEKCSSLQKISIPTALKVLDARLFSACTSLKEVSIPDGCKLSTIRNYAFSGCAFDSFKIPTTVTAVYNNAFFGCEELTSVEWSPNVDVIDESMFLGCIKLKQVIFPAPIKKISDKAFQDCVSLNNENFSFPKGLEEIGQRAFRGCEKFYQLKIPSTVKKIGGGAFEGCINLSEIDFPSSLEAGCGLSDWSNLDLEIEDVKATSVTYRLTVRGITIDGKVPTFGLDGVLASEDGIVKLKQNPNSYNEWVSPFVVFPKFTCRSIAQCLSDAWTPQLVKSFNVEKHPDVIRVNVELNNYDEEYVDLEKSYLRITNSENQFPIKNCELEVDFAQRKGYRVTLYAYIDGEYYSKEFVTFDLPSPNFNRYEVIQCGNNSVRIKADTNVDYEIEASGFEWKEANAENANIINSPIIDGKLSVSLRNLQEATTYVFRPYYKASNGQVIYGSWNRCSLRTGEYIEPEVKTLPRDIALSIESGNVTLYGLALSGTDDILYKGFEYRQQSITRSASQDWITVLIPASSVLMSTTLSDIKPGCEYVCRAFVETSKGRFYGAEEKFTTPISSAIDDLSADYANVSVTASNGHIVISNLAGDALAKVYNMQGALVAETAERVIDSLSPDLYIVSVGGKTFKVMLK